MQQLHLCLLVFGIFSTCWSMEPIPPKELKIYPSEYLKAFRDKDYKDANVHKTLAPIALKAGLKEFAAFHQRLAFDIPFSQKCHEIFEKSSTLGWMQILQIARSANVPAHVHWATRQHERMLLGVAWNKASATTAQIAVIKDAISKGWGIDAVPWAQSLAKSGERDPAVLAVAGWINVEGVWMDAWEYCKKLGADKDWKKRRTIHDQLSKDRNTLFPKTWPNDPYGGAIWDSTKWYWPNDPCHAYPLVAVYGMNNPTEEKASYRIMLPDGYVPTKSWPLIVELHGGGSGGYSYALGSSMLSCIPHQQPDFKSPPAVMIYPVVNLHSMNAWSTADGMNCMITSIEDCMQRCNIDPSRIYLTGCSMGGNGCMRVSWIIPEAFARYLPVAGCYWNQVKPIPDDLSGVEYLILHGAKDAGFRNKSYDEVLKILRSHKAEVQTTLYPDLGHDHPKDFDVIMNKFFSVPNKHITDWRLARRIVTETNKDVAQWAPGEDPAKKKAGK
jgi:predicted esterase